MSSCLGSATHDLSLARETYSHDSGAAQDDTDKDPICRFNTNTHPVPHLIQFLFLNSCIAHGVGLGGETWGKLGAAVTKEDFYIPRRTALL